jgi:hypothetical protein
MQKPLYREAEAVGKVMALTPKSKAEQLGMSSEVGSFNLVRFMIAGPDLSLQNPEAKKGLLF